MTANEALTAKILAERRGELLNVEAIWAEARADLEERHDHLFDN